MKPGIGPHVAPHHSCHRASGGLRPCWPSPWPFLAEGHLWSCIAQLHGCHPLPTGQQGLATAFFNCGYLVHGGQLGFGASGWLPSIHLQACTQGLGAQRSPGWQGYLTLGLRQQSGNGGRVLKPMFDALFHRALTTHWPFPCDAFVPLSAPATLYISSFKDIRELKNY